MEFPADLVIQRFTAVALLFVILVVGRPRALRVPAYWWLIAVAIAGLNAILTFSPWAVSPLRSVTVVAVPVIMLALLVLLIRNFRRV